jgi:hypothetical protein
VRGNSRSSSPEYASPGRFLKLPDHEKFSADERARFFTLFNAMSVDYVLVSKKTTGLSASLSWMIKVMS